MRPSEVVALRNKDVRIEQMWTDQCGYEWIVSVFSEKRKNDQIRAGHTALLASTPEALVSPVAWVRLYLSLKKNPIDKDEPFFANRWSRKPLSGRKSGRFFSGFFSSISLERGTTRFFHHS